MINHFTTQTIKCVCHSIRTMFRVLGMYNFDWNLDCEQASQAGKELNHIAPCDSDSNTTSDIVKVLVSHRAGS